MSRRLMLRNKSGATPILPIEYQQVEWIGYAAGTKVMIDLGIVANQADEIRIGLAKKTVPSRGTVVVSTTQGGSGAWATIENASGSKWLCSPSKSITELFDFTEFVFSNKNTTSSYSLVFGYLAGSFIPELQYSYYEVYTNGQLVFDGVPCYRKADEEIGLYDIITDTFLTNTENTTLTKGADV